MIFDENPIFEITEIIMQERKTGNFKTKRRNITVFSCRISGSADFTCKDEKLTVNKGDILYIPKNIEYSQKTEGETIIAVHLKIYNKVSSSGIECVFPRDKSAAVECFFSMYREWSSKQPGYRQRAAALLYELMADIKNERCKASDNLSSKIINSLTYMKSHFYLPSLSIAEIAAQSNISEIYFRKIWQSLYTDTPARCLTKLRISYAKSLLADGDYSISEIAERSGFSDAKYFSTKFKSVTGKSPSAYRRGP